MDLIYFSNIPEYDQKKEDLMDCYNYLLDNTEGVDSAEDFDLAEFDFSYQEASIDIISAEISRLKPIFEEIETDKKRIEKIEQHLSLDYPVYIYEGEIIAGVHRSIAFYNKNIENIPVVLITKIK